MHMNTYKVVFKKGYVSNFYHESIEAENIDEASDSIYQIENGLLRREPTLERWKGCHMANTDKWYFAYTIEGNTIIIVDACHAQNMHED